MKRDLGGILGGKERPLAVDAWDGEVEKGVADYGEEPVRCKAGVI